MEINKNFPIALTFDIDWAPDFAVKKIVDILELYEVPGTLFLTHPSNYIESLKDHPLIKLGIHPNFLPNSTHGQTVDEIMQYVLDLCPNARAMRTHGLFQSSNLYLHILKKYPQIKYDFTLFLPENPYCLPFKFWNDQNDFMIRIPYHWEDNFFYLSSECYNKKNIIYTKAFYQIFDFHPIHLYLNSSNPLEYENIKMTFNSPLYELKENEIEKYVNKNYGTFSYLTDLLDFSERERFVFATEIPNLLNLFSE